MPLVKNVAPGTVRRASEDDRFSARGRVRRERNKKKFSAYFFPDAGVQHTFTINVRKVHELVVPYQSRS